MFSWLVVLKVVICHILEPPVDCIRSCVPFCNISGSVISQSKSLFQTHFFSLFVLHDWWRGKRISRVVKVPPVWTFYLTSDRSLLNSSMSLLRHHTQVGYFDEFSLFRVENIVFPERRTISTAHANNYHKGELLYAYWRWHTYVFFKIFRI